MEIYHRSAKKYVVHHIDPKPLDVFMVMLLTQLPKIVYPNANSETFRCLHGYAFDAITQDCVPKCEQSCNEGFCTFCICYGFNKRNFKFNYFANGTECARISKAVTCDDETCTWAPMETCHAYYVFNPLDSYECIPRCVPDLCKNGRCTLYGYCSCDAGYRPDPINPMTCIEIPNYTCKNITQEIETSKINNETAVADCSHYRNDTTYSANSTNPCECADGNDTNKTINNTSESQFNKQDIAVRMVPNRFTLYISILASVIAILLIAVFVLTFIIIKMKKQKSMVALYWLP
ncbi:hypothetical protein QE152_g29427 [Popillia japonica]